MGTLVWGLHQVADHAQLERSLAEIRGSRFALSHDEIQADVYGIAAAIRDGTRVFGSLGILVPVSRAGGLIQLAGKLVAAAERIAEAMRDRGTVDSAKGGGEFITRETAAQGGA